MLLTWIAALLTLASTDTLTLETLDGKPVAVSLHAPDRPLIVHFWATWCPSCVEELPVLEQSVRERCAERVRLLAVNVEEGREKIEGFLAGNALSIEVLRDPLGQSFRSTIGGGLPANLIATQEGVRSVSGPRSAAKWRELLAQLGCR